MFAIPINGSVRADFERPINIPLEVRDVRSFDYFLRFRPTFCSGIGIILIFEQMLFTRDHKLHRQLLDELRSFANQLCVAVKSWQSQLGHYA
jgi:hypothetical protein